MMESRFVHFCLPKVDYVVEPIKPKDVDVKTILGGSTLAICTNFPPKFHDVTFDIVKDLNIHIFTTYARP